MDAEPADATPFLPPRRSLKDLREAAADCRGCALWRSATQTVFGEGPRDARVMLVGEVPGDREDRDGRPFVGPAGRELDGAIKACRPWFRAELEAIGPQALLILGATAGKELLGNTFRLTEQRGRPLESDLAPVVLATIHPSAILRERGSDARSRARDAFIADLRAAAALLEHTDAA